MTVDRMTDMGPRADLLAGEKQWDRAWLAREITFARQERDRYATAVAEVRQLCEDARRNWVEQALAPQDLPDRVLRAIGRLDPPEVA